MIGLPDTFDLNLFVSNMSFLGSVIVAIALIFYAFKIAKLILKFTGDIG